MTNDVLYATIASITFLILFMYYFLRQINKQRYIQDNMSREELNGPIVAYKEQSIKFIYAKSANELEHNINEWLNDAGVNMVSSQYIQDYAVMITYTVSRYKVKE